jgi:hypothetical protein
MRRKETQPAMIRHTGLALCLALIATAGAAAREQKPEPLALKMSAYISPAQSDVIVRMRVEPDARSRELTVAWIADDLSGGSTAIALDGARAATMHQFPLRRLTPGYYTVVATLRMSDGTEVRRQSNLTVVGVGGLEAIGGRRGAAAGAFR